MQYSWNQLLVYDCTVPNVSFQRDLSVQTAYNEHKLNLLSQGLTLEQYIKNNVLKNNDHILAVNKFPYNIEKGIKHYLFLMSPNNKLPMEDVKKYLTNRFKCEVIVFENSIENRSIPGISHYQVFMREP